MSCRSRISFPVQSVWCSSGFTCLRAIYSSRAQLERQWGLATARMLARFRITARKSKGFFLLILLFTFSRGLERRERMSIWKVLLMAVDSAVWVTHIVEELQLPHTQVGMGLGRHCPGSDSTTSAVLLDYMIGYFLHISTEAKHLVSKRVHTPSS